MSDEVKQETAADERKQATFFAAVRARGMLNAMLDGPSKRFEEENPGFRCRWEYDPPGDRGDHTMVIAREAMGFKLVDASEMGDLTASEARTGPVRRGDLVLMAAPDEIVDLLELEDAKMAHEDFHLPEATYREYLESLKVKTKSGEMMGSRATGRIRQTVEQKAAAEQKHDL